MMEITTMPDPGHLSTSLPTTRQMWMGTRCLTPHAIDPRNEQTLAALRKRTPSGGYEVSDADLVRAIRAWDARGDLDAVRALSVFLIDRCMPEFRRRAWGLRHRPRSNARCDQRDDRADIA